ncbi:MAG: HAD family hydrolase [Saprospiraceae bacterium]
MPSPIIFDIDGTLADTKAVDDKCFVQAFQETFQIDLQNQDWAALKNVTDHGITAEIIQTNYNRSPTSAELAQMKDRLIELLESELRNDHLQFQPVKGAIDFFSYLKEETNHPLGIATGAWEESAVIKLGGIGLDFSNIAFANSNHHITRAGITRYALQQIKKQRPDATDDIIYFGDGAWDYKTCKELGIRFIGIDVLEDGKLRDLGAETVFSDFRDIQQIMTSF